MRKYTAPELEITKFQAEDFITASGSLTPMTEMVEGYSDYTYNSLEWKNAE